MMNKHIGKSYDKVDSKGILSGKPSYTGDFVPKDALVIKAFVVLMLRRASNLLIHLKPN